MPYYTCTCCGNKVSYPKADEELHRFREWECALCYTVIHARRYRAPSSGDVVMFGPAGPGIGDYVFKNFLMERFQAQHPGVEIIDVTGSSVIALGLGADLFFWADNAGVSNPPPPMAIEYILTNEVLAYVKSSGLIPGLWFEPHCDGHNRDDVRRSVVLNMRHIGRCEDKNVTSDEAKKLFALLDALYLDGDIRGLILVGNDTPVDGESLPDYAFDLRGKLELSEIAWLCKHAMLTIGKDSGILHIAAAAGGYVVGWGFFLREWFPITQEGRSRAFVYDAPWAHVEEAIIGMVNIRNITLAQYLPESLPKWCRV